MLHFDASAIFPKAREAVFTKYCLEQTNYFVCIHVHKHGTYMYYICALIHVLNSVLIVENVVNT